MQKYDHVTEGKSTMLVLQSEKNTMVLVRKNMVLPQYDDNGINIYILFFK